jgi:hypothetical protein
MKTGNEISEELKSMGSPLAGLSRAMPYSVPEGYFDRFASGLSDTISTINETEQVPAWGKTLPYALPNGYFEGLTNEIVTVAKANHLNSDNPLKVPDGYFETFPQQVLIAAKATDKESHVIQVKRGFIVRSIKWAVAAVLIVAIGFGAYISLFDQGNADDRMLASVPDSEIHDYLQNTYSLRMDVDRVVGNSDIGNLQLDSKEIIQYLNETGWD